MIASSGPKGRSRRKEKGRKEGKKVRREGERKEGRKGGREEGQGRKGGRTEGRRNGRKVKEGRSVCPHTKPKASDLQVAQDGVLPRNVRCHYVWRRDGRKEE